MQSYNPQSFRQPENPESKNKEANIAARATIIGAIITVIGAIIVALITGGFGLIHNSNAVPESVSPGTTPITFPILHKDYNSGVWTQNGGQQIAFSMTGVVENSDGTFTAAGGTLGLCSITVSDGKVTQSGNITFSIQQIANVSTNCLSLTADLHGSVNEDGSNPNGGWSGQFQGQPLSGQWNLS